MLKKTAISIILSWLMVIANAQYTETANVNTPGTLNIVAKAYLSTVTNLTVTGTIDARDFKTMRDSMPVLSVLNLSGSAIAAYTGTYGTWNTTSNTYAANAIPQAAFCKIGTDTSKKTLTSITLPINITSIGDDAFYNCTGFTGTLTLPSSITAIGEDAFSYTRFTGSLTIPASVTYIGPDAFFNCRGLTGSLTIPSLVTNIGDNAFMFCSGFTGTLTLPSSITAIGILAFWECSGLTSIISLNTTPLNGFTMDSYVFFGESKVKLYVPWGSVDAYNAAPQWNSFNILPIIQISASNDTIHIGKSATFKANTDSIGVHLSLIWQVNGKNAGTGDRIFSYIPENGDIISCKAIIDNDTVTSNTIVMKVTGETLSISPKLLDIAAEANSTANFNLISNISWKINNNQTWLNPNVNSGNNNAVITLTAAANPNFYPRTDTIIISGNGVLSDTVIVTQAAVKGASLSLMTDSLALVDLFNSTNGPGWNNHTNWLTGPVSTWYGITIDTNRVTGIYLVSNNLTGTIPNSIGNLSKLNTLDLSNNQLNGLIPTTLFYLSNLNYLYLFKNQLSGSIPDNIGNLSQLRVIYIFSNKLTGSIPASVENLINLQQLAVNNNQLNGNITSYLCNLPDLKMLDLGDNQLNGNIPSSIGNLTQLQYCYFNNNQLSGNIPSSIGDLINLIQLDISTNQLDGTIPSSISNLANLSWLALEDNKLSGIIPSSTGNLTLLQYFIISSNQLSGPIPFSIGNLTKLNWILFEDNQLSGIIPNFIGNLTNLTEIDLSDNKFSGPIPSSIKNLSDLEYFYISDNNFTGLPELPVSAYSNQYAKVDSNNLTFNSIVPNITKLSTYSNQAEVGNTDTVNGTIGNSIAINLGIDSTLTTNVYTWYKNGTFYKTTAVNNLVINNFTASDTGVYTCTITNSSAPQLTLYSYPTTLVIPKPKLSVSTNELNIAYTANSTANFNITSNVSWKINKLQTWLNPNVISGNDNAAITLTATANPTIFQRTGTLIVSAAGVKSDTVFVTQAADSIAVLANELKSDSLALVDLYNSTNGPGWTNYSNWLTGPVNSWFGITIKDSRVVSIDMGINNLRGTIPSSICNLTKLNGLGLNSNQLSGTIPNMIGNLTNLTFDLDLSYNQLSGNIPYSIGDLILLQNFSINNNDLSGSIPNSIGNLSKLTWLNFGENQLNDNLPSSIGNLTNLAFLDISNNQVSGSIPVSIGDLTQLQALVLANNEFNGSIPNSIGNLNKLTFLELGGNQLSGNIPNSIWNLIQLQGLYFNNNLLTGSIPDLIGNLINLQQFDISTNQMSGIIPSSICYLTNLTLLFLEDNQLNGNIPNMIGNLTNLYYGIDLSYNQLSGSIPSSIETLTNLQTFDISYNNFNSLPDLPTFPANSNLAQVNNNNLTFNSIIPNLDKLQSYGPQANVGKTDTITGTVGKSITINLGIDSTLTTNVYSWYKNGEFYTTASVNNLAINNITASDAGVYTCTITNPGAPLLTLYSNPVTVIVQSNGNTTDVLTLQNSDVNLYPIPVTGYLNVSLPYTSVQTSLSIFNISGVEIYSSNISGNLTEIDMSSYSAGIYIVKITSPDKGVITRKIIKE